MPTPPRLESTWHIHRSIQILPSLSVEHFYSSYTHYLHIVSLIPFVPCHLHMLTSVAEVCLSIFNAFPSIHSFCPFLSHKFINKWGRKLTHCCAYPFCFLCWFEAVFVINLQGRLFCASLHSHRRLWKMTYLLFSGIRSLNHDQHLFW